jgi:ABC-type glycerol-3-phosphate transport system substrate-binding protein
MKGNFQLIVLVIFIFAAIVGILVFSGAIPIGKSDAPGSLGTVTLWGTIPSNIISPILEDFNKANPTFIVNYSEKAPETFDQDLLEALATGTGPDMFFLTDNLAYHYANKIFPIPYTSYPLATFKNVFAGAGEVFLTNKGILAFPITIDPLMMYYDRSILDANGIVYPPATWSELIDLMPTLVKKDEANKILKPAVALGQFSNVVNAKDIISALFLQAGNPIVSESQDKYVSTLTSSVGNYNIPSILQFYTDFTDPGSAVYSWNKSFPNSKDAFSANITAFYFGFASELKSLLDKNPNQNFSITAIPQIKGSNFKATFSRVTGIAISSLSKNLNTAFTASNLMTSGDFASRLAFSLNVAPARRDLLASKPNDAYSPIFYNSALYAKSWVDPSPKDTLSIFKGMVENVLSGNLSTGAAIQDANAKMSLLLR